MEPAALLDEGKTAYEAALHRAVVAITTSAIEGTLGTAFDEGTKFQEAITASRELNVRLKDHLRDLNQRAATLGRALPTLSAEGKILLHAMFNATDDSWKSSTPPTASSSSPSDALKRGQSMSLLKNPIGEKEPEDILFHYPALATYTKSSGRSRINQSTWTIEDKESDPLQSQNCYAVVQRIQNPSSTKPSDPSLASSALSLQALKRKGEESGLKAHWFWHANLREDERMTPSVVCGCSRSRGIQIKASEDLHRVQGKESISLSDIKVVTLGMSASAFRDWCARNEAKATQDKLNSAEFIEGAMGSSDASQSNRLRVVRRALTVSLKESRRSALFGMWFTDVTIIFDTIDEMNAFLASFLLSISYVQWGVNAFDMVESPQVMPPSLVLAIDAATAAGDMKPAERDLCSTYHIPPADYLAIKERVLAPFSPPCMGIEDLFLAAPAVNIFQLLWVVKFFEKNHWVSLHRLYRRL
jgi:hypothetical protein